MNLVFLLLAPFPIGYFVRRRSTAIAIYLAADSLVFTYQSFNELLLGLSGHEGQRNAYWLTSGDPYYDFDYRGFGSYAVVNLAIILVSIGLVVLGNRIRAKRKAKRNTLTVG